MATMLETPSRIWRRIEAIEERDMPSLPSLPSFEDSEDPQISNQFDEFEPMSSQMHSTPASNYQNSTARPSSSSSTARFANSVASRSSKSLNTISSSRGISTRQMQHDSFDVPSVPHINPDNYSVESEDEEATKSSVPDVYLPPPEDEEGEDRDLNLSRSPIYSTKVSREVTPKKGFDYSVSLKSEPKPSPYEKYRNVAIRRTNPRARTPSLSRTSSSQASSPSHSTPQSNRSLALSQSRSGSPISALTVPLPRSATASPAAIPEDHPENGDDYELSYLTRDDEAGVRSMDITDVHISPPRLEDDGNSDHDEDAEGHETSHKDSRAPDDEREPTFSSDGDPIPYSYNNKAITQNVSAVSSSPSLAFTPTPAFPRPRARFDLPPPVSNLNTNKTPDEQEDQPSDEPLTPHTRRRSFLLSVVNSTTRPRMKFPTPHPRKFDTPGVEETPIRSSTGESSSRSNLQTVFAGFTPRPRMALINRVSHPLSQGGTPPSDSDPSPVAATSPTAWATPAHPSPYDGGDRASFISTASSHDLTTHHRINTSFDPSMGFGGGAPGHGVGRFNAGKLNTYLHGLNRRLQEENEMLIEKLRKVEEEHRTDFNTTGVPDTSRRISAASRRASGVGTLLGNVQEDVAEGWMEEKAELEDMVEAFKIEVTNCMAEKEEVERALEEQKVERERDKDRWKDRMTEIEQGVSGIVSGLEQKLEEAEKQARNAEVERTKQTRAMENVIVEIEAERDLAMERASKAERVLESGRDLGSDLKDANDRVAQVMGDLRNANVQIKDLEDEVMHSDARIDELEGILKENKILISGLEGEVASVSDDLAAERNKVKKYEGTIRQLDTELRSAKEYAAELEEGATEAVSQIDRLAGELTDAQETIKGLAMKESQVSQDLKALEHEVIQSRETNRQMEEALEEAEQKMMSDEEALAELRSKVSALERERQRESSNASHDVSRPPVDSGPTEEEFQALESELDDANKEISRLSTLLSQSPARRAIEKAKDTKIEMLEREKEELLERNRALRLTFNEATTPRKVINTSGISPIHRQVLSMSIRAPKTPGGPLKDMSWLNTTAGDPSVMPLISEINRLQRELDLANESIDDKLDKLEDAGMGVVSLTKKLEDARARIVNLEDEIGRLNRKEERRIRRLGRARCQKCNIKLDLRYLINPDESSVEVFRDDLPREPPTPPTRTSEALKANLYSVNQHLDDLKGRWEAEKKRLLGEKVALQNDANRLNIQVKSTKEEAKKVLDSNKASEKLRTNTENELENAKQKISVLEHELSSERSRLRSLITEQERMQREKKQISNELQRTEMDMDEVKQQLQRFKQEHHEIEKELRENANIEQKARLLETRVVENAHTIDQLRQERSLLAADHKQLQRRFAEINETVNNLRNEYAAHSNSHDNRRHELDLHRLEIDDLRRALDERTNDIHKMGKEKEKIATEKNDVARTVAALEADLKRVKRNAEAFGRDLKLLRAEKEKLETTNMDEISKAERAKKQAQTQIRLLTEQLEAQKEKIARSQEQIDNHVCRSDETQLSSLKLQHNKECKGLMVQIRYLKAKFTRESFFRGDLTYQKQYLLIILSQFEKSERTILSSLAQIGFPVNPPPRKKSSNKFKSVALIVIFTSRIKRSSESWRQACASKPAIVEALEEVRRKRIPAAG